MTWIDPRRREPMPRGLLVVVGIMAAIELLLSAADAGLLGAPDLRREFLLRGAFWSQLLRGTHAVFAGQQATMFVTHAFLHGGMLHMAMNATILLALGRLVADHYGPRAVLPLFFIGAVAGGAVFGLLNAGPAPMVGASGADFAFLGVWTVWDLGRHRAAGVAARPVWTRVGVLIALNVGMYVALGGMLAWEAHLGGFLAGLAFGWVLERRRAAE